MPAFEAQQPQAQQMELPTQGAPVTEQPRQVEGMTADSSVHMRGGGLCVDCLACCALEEICACIICDECCC